MATIVTNVKWAHNTEELKKSLISGIDVISAMKQAVDRTAQSLGGTGLLAAANRTAAAVNQLNGVNKLTVSEQERVNAQLTKAIEKYNALGVKVPTVIADLQKLTAANIAAAKGTQQLETQTASLSERLTKVGSAARTIGVGLSAAITAPIVGIGATALKVGIDFESAFAGVRKTVDATEPEFVAMAASFRNLAKAIPVSVNELARLGEAAGALGIPKQEITKFAEVMAKLGVTTNLTSDQAAEAIAKIQNIFGAAGKETENFASTLVALGNAGASTEAEITELAKRIAGAGNSIGLTQAQVLGFSAAIADVGIEAEAGGSAISRIFTEISVAVSKGGTAVANFARIAGKSVAEFSQIFKQDAAEATTLFIEGLGRIKNSGGDLIGTLESLGFSELRQADLLKRLSGNADNLRTSLDRATNAWRENTALSKEAQERFKTTESQLFLLWSRIKDVGITLFNALKPGLDSALAGFNSLLPAVEKMATAFAEMPRSVQVAGIGLAGLAAATGPALIAMGGLAFGIRQLAELGTTFPTLGARVSSALNTISQAGPGATGALAAVGKHLAGFPLVVAGAQAALVGLGIGTAFIIFERKIRETIERLERDFERLRKLGSEEGRTELDVASYIDPKMREAAQKANEAAAKVRELRDLVEDLPPLPEGYSSASLGGKSQIKPQAPRPIGALAIPLDFAKGLDTGPMITSLTGLHAPLKTTTAAVQTLSEKVKALTAANREDIIAEYEKTGSIKAAAAAAGVATDVTGAFIRQQKLGKTGANEYAKAWKELNSLGEDYAATLAALEPEQLKTLRGYLAAEASVETLAAAYPNLTKAQITAVKKFDEASAKSLDALKKRMDAFKDEGVSAAQEIGKSLAGIPKVLRELSQSMGNINLDAKPIAVTGVLIGDVFTDAGEQITDAMTAAARSFLPLRAEQVATIRQMDAVGKSADQIAKTLNISVGQVQKVLKTSTSDILGGLRELAESFTQLAQIGGPAFSQITRAAGSLLVVLKQIGAANANVAASIKASVDAGGSGTASAAAIASQVASYVTLVATIYSLVDAYLKQQQAEKVRLGQERALQDLYKKYPGITKQVAEAIRNASIIPESGLVSPTDLQEALHLADIIRDLGGIAHLTADQMAGVNQSFENLFTIITGKGPYAKQALSVLDDTLADMGASATKSGGLVSQYFLDMMKRAQAAGLELEKVNAFLLDQTRTNIVGGLSGFVASGKDAKATLEDVRKKMAEIKGERDDLMRRGTLGVSDSKRLEELNKEWAALEKKAKDASGVIAGTAIKTQEAAYALGATVFAAFNQMQKAGVPITDIMAQLGPVVEDLQAKFEAAGFDGGAAFNSIRAMASLAKDEIAGPIISGINGLGQALAGLHNIGALDQNTFAGLTQQITGMYQSLVKQGKGGVDALRLLQQPLQTIWQLHTDTGLAIDGATQALLDEAQAQGIVGDKMRPVQEKQLIATQRIATAVEAIATAFGVLPQKAEAAAKGISDGLAKIKIPKVDIAYRYYQDGEGPGGAGGGTGGSGGGGRQREFAATGGIVRPSGIQHFAGGGVTIRQPYPLLPRGRDVIPAMLTPGEWIFNEPQQQRLVTELNAGAVMAKSLAAVVGPAGLTTTQPGPVHFHFDVDGREFAEIVWDPQVLSGKVRERARLQVRQMEKER